MKSKAATLLLLISTLLANAQSAPEIRSQEPSAGGVWTDPATGLMWAAKDNGKDVRWKDAVKYCRDLRLAGHSDWRLATRDELGAIYDRNANASGLAGSGKDNLFTYHVKGGLFLTGDEWTSERRDDDRGRPSGYAWYFDFNEGKSNNDPISWPYPFVGRRALCVRVPGK